MEQDRKSGFTFRSTAEEVTKGIDASGLTAIVTGATAGIGTETARVLALRGAHVYLTGRSVKSATETKEAILKDIPDAKLDILAPLDLISQASEEGVTNVTVNSLHPGRIKTSIGRHNSLLFYFIYAISFWTWKTIPQGAATTVYVALHPSVKGVSGKCFADNNEFDSKHYHPLAEDEQEAKKCWDLSVQLTST